MPPPNIKYSGVSVINANLFSSLTPRSASMQDEADILPLPEKFRPGRTTPLLSPTTLRQGKRVIFYTIYKDIASLGN